MLISQIVQLDAQSNEFAKKNAAAQIGRSDGGESFADYLAATMNRDQSSREPAALQTESSPRDRTPEKAHRQDVRVEKAPDDGAAREAAGNEAEKLRDQADRTRQTTESASSQEKPKKSEAAVPENERKAKSTAADSERVTTQREVQESREVPAETVRAIDRVFEARDENTGLSGEDSRAVRKAEKVRRAAAVSSRRVSQSKVEIDVRVDLDEAGGAEASKSAKKSSDAFEARERAADTDLVAKKSLRGQPQSESARKLKASDDSFEARAEIGSAVRSKPEKAETRSESEERSGGAERRVEVRDLRAERGHQRNNGDTRDGGDGRRNGGEAAVGGDQSSETELRDSQPTTDRSSRFEALRSEGGPTSAASRGSQSSARAMSGTAANLRQTLQESLNAEIVRSARLVVRGNGRGEIRLNLRPDSLGNVRISLQMQDGHIAGRIIVDNQIVREVFEQNLASLQKAFEENGLEAGGVEISLADSGNQPDQKSTDEPSHRASVRDVADRFGYSVPDLSTIDEYHDLVDVVV